MRSNNLEMKPPKQDFPWTSTKTSKTSAMKSIPNQRQDERPVRSDSKLSNSSWCSPVGQSRLRWLKNDDTEGRKRRVVKCKIIESLLICEALFMSQSRRGYRIYAYIIMWMNQNLCWMCDTIMICILRNFSLLWSRLCQQPKGTEGRHSDTLLLPIIVPLAERKVVLDFLDWA